MSIREMAKSNQKPTSIVQAHAQISRQNRTRNNWALQQGQVNSTTSKSKKVSNFNIDDELEWLRKSKLSA